ncbi:DUF1016 N-terminal domain-containing protein [Maridesulfovibrio frigidus]|uniref:hypothetical protein n=1 Tax=Maridesulfovibrio frigidus TaxID=340956 RepID=UPI0004E128F1|nr:hypothetical protein [Maridesulfovibrio frigidus]
MGPLFQSGQPYALLPMGEELIRLWLNAGDVRSLKQIKAAVSVNKELLQFYWELGVDIIEQQKESILSLNRVESQ